ncbi:MAG: hypothetical protein ACLSUZ_06745 [Bifidobacterium pseudocatenulatum]
MKLALSAAAVAVEDGVELTVTAKSYVRDLFCMADKVDAKASVAEGMVSLLPGESVVLHIATADAAALAARCVRSRQRAAFRQRSEARMVSFREYAVY